jgi:hypothetical protein
MEPKGAAKSESSPELPPKPDRRRQQPVKDKLSHGSMVTLLTKLIRKKGAIRNNEAI